MASQYFNDGSGAGSALLRLLSNLVDNTSDKPLLPLTNRFGRLCDYMKTRALLADDDSVRLYDRLLTNFFATDISGAAVARELFPIHDREYWKEIRAAERAVELPMFERYMDGTDRKVFRESFVMDAYSYKDICGVKHGDVVIDGGAYVGDTAYAFSEKAGPAGHIYCFEPSPDIHKKFEKNLALVPLRKTISAVNAGLSDKEGKLGFTFIIGNVAGSRVDPNGEIQVDITTVDAFVDREKPSKVDFIKMDIEGSECAALRGAENTIKKYRPQMAICIYHKTADHWEVPRTILSFDPNYRFYVRHHTEDSTETVMYCVPCESAPVASCDEKTLRAIQDFWSSCYSALLKDHNSRFFDRILRAAEAESPHRLTWEHSGDNYNFMRANISYTGQNHYKLHFDRFRFFVALVFESRSEYNDKQKNAIRKLFEGLENDYPDFKTTETNHGHFFGGFNIPYSTGAENPELVGMKLAQLLKLSAETLKEHNIIYGANSKNIVCDKIIYGGGRTFKSLRKCSIKTAEMPQGSCGCQMRGRFGKSREKSRIEPRVSALVTTHLFKSNQNYSDAATVLFRSGSEGDFGPRSVLEAT
jgi:FkbM family methyltransferase